MIVRIATEGQYRMKSSHLDELNEIDDEIVNAVSNGEHERFTELFNQLLEIVRSNGKPLDPDELAESAIVLPPPDTTFEEAKQLFIGEGIVPVES